ncbi:MAG: glycosyltransferase [Lachnospiraceae bacterium]|nr:glycosyltransferase [Lachnospiraceae bacterium]
MEQRMVDVIIPVYKPDERFRLLLQKLQEQTFAVHKVILVNTEEELWERYLSQADNQKFLAGLRLPLEIFHVPAEEFDHGGTRRLAVERSDAPCFVCMTQDAVPADKHLIEALVRPIWEGGASASYARQLPREGCSIIERYTRSFNYPDQDLIKTKEDLPRLGIKTFFCSNACAAYARADYEALGGFEAHTIFNEDMIYGARAILSGRRVAYASGARVVHSHNYTGAEQYRRNFDLAVSQAQHPEIFGLVRSESEGLRLVKQTAGYLLTIGRPWLIVNLIWQSGWKYLGYRAGKRYRRMNQKQILRRTMNPGYWKQHWKRRE